MSSGTCQNFCGSGRRNRIDRRECQPGVVDQDLRGAQPLPCRRHDAVAFGRAAQIGDERQDTSGEIGANARRFDLPDICLYVADGKNRVALAGETKRHCAAETAQPAGDDRDPSFHRSLSVVVGQDPTVPIIQAEFGRILDRRCSRKRRTTPSGSSRIACA